MYVHDSITHINIGHVKCDQKPCHSTACNILWRQLDTHEHALYCSLLLLDIIEVFNILLFDQIVSIFIIDFGNFILFTT